LFFFCKIPRSMLLTLEEIQTDLQTLLYDIN